MLNIWLNGTSYIESCESTLSTFKLYQFWSLRRHLSRGQKDLSKKDLLYIFSVRCCCCCFMLSKKSRILDHSGCVHLTLIASTLETKSSSKSFLNYSFSSAVVMVQRLPSTSMTQVRISEVLYVKLIEKNQK